MLGFEIFKDLLDEHAVEEMLLEGIQDMKIEDKPASWGNHSEYRLLGGDAKTNWFEVKAASVSSMQ